MGMFLKIEREFILLDSNPNSNSTHLNFQNRFLLIKQFPTFLTKTLMRDITIISILSMDN